MMEVNNQNQNQGWMRIKDLIQVPDSVERKCPAKIQRAHCSKKCVWEERERYI